MKYERTLLGEDADYPISFVAKPSDPYQQSNFALKYILDDDNPL